MKTANGNRERRVRGRKLMWGVVCAVLPLFVLPASGQGVTYGSGTVIDVPRVDPANIEIDGVADEEAWSGAQRLSLEAGELLWSGGWNNGYAPEPDINVTAQLLYATDTLYVHVLFGDYQTLWFGEEGGPGGGEQILIAVDAVHEAGVTDTLIDFDFAGWPANAPDLGPTTYKITRPEQGGITLNWGSEEINPVEEGWVNGVVWVEEDTYTWGTELAIYVPTIEQGAQIGFNLAGATAHPDPSFEYEEGARDYGWFMWQAGEPPCAPSLESDEPGYDFCTYVGGAAMAGSKSFGSLNFIEATAVGIEERPTNEIPTRFAVEQNYPNPFNPSTTIKYSLHQPASVRLAVYNMLGQKVSTLAEGQRSVGTYEVRWVPDNLPSGVYFYRLEVDGSVVATRKMMLVK